MDKLEACWRDRVRPGDAVVLAGDIEWALHLEDALFTLERLHAWNGFKILVRGNHDYWWSSKTTNRVRRILPPSIRLLHNDSVVVEEVNICGCKGSPIPGGIDWTPEKEKLLQREIHRLKLSLEARNPGLQTIVGIHYPPFYPNLGASPYKDLLEQFSVAACVYGHLHGGAAGSGPKGQVDGVQYRLVASDYVNFCPVPIWDKTLLAT